MSRRLTFIVSAVLHAAAGTALITYSFWSIDKLQPKHTPVVFAAEPPPPPPPRMTAALPDMPDVPVRKGVKNPSSSSPRKVATPTTTPVPEMTQPTDGTTTTTTTEVGGETTSGQTGPEGDPLGTTDGTSLITVGTTDIAGETPVEPPKPPAVKQMKNVAPKLLEASRLSGDPQIAPPASVAARMATEGLTRLNVTVKLCLDTSGVPTKVSFLKRSGFAEYDEKIESEMRAWRYYPYTVDGDAVPVCTSIVFQIDRE